MARLRGDARYAAQWAAGAAMNVEQAIAAALALAAPASPDIRAAPTGQTGTEPLTRREREIARLVARGDSDREIADALFLSVGTVSIHVHHILQKLGLRSRWQVADRLAAPDAPRDDPQ
jgi:DNA-binding NarL/FixJ family response regulator